MKRSLALFFVLAVFMVLSPIIGSGEKRQSIKNMDISSKTPGKEIAHMGAVKPRLNVAKLPLYFIANKGQVNEQAAFYAKASRYTLWLTKEGLVFDSFKRSKAKSERVKKERRQRTEFSRDVSRLLFVGANKNPEISAGKPAKLKVNYFIGSDPSRWHCAVPTAMTVLYKNLYKNIDLKVYGIEKQIEYDWVVKPGGSPGDIRFAYKSVKGTRIDDEGNLVIATEFGELVHKKPVSYQVEKAGRQKGRKAKRQEGTEALRQKESSSGVEGHVETQHLASQRDHIDVGFKKVGKNTYGFALGVYDRSRELIIDPMVLVYSTYLGGGSKDQGEAIAVDGSGCVYVTGRTESTNFPTLDQYQADQGGWDVVVAVLDTTQAGAASLVYSTYLGGGSRDYGEGIAVDDSGYAYVTGYTDSTDFPTLNQYQADQGTWDAFVIKLDPTQSGASSLLYSTYLGGGSYDWALGIAVDGSGHAYVTGETYSPDFPILNQYQANQGSSDVFVAVLDTTQAGAASLLYSTYLGGGDFDYGQDIAVDGSGYAYVIGCTLSTNFPTLNHYQADPGDDNRDIFVARLDPTQAGAASLLYSTYLGGNHNDLGRGIALDGSGHVYVTGGTYSTDFPTLNQYQADQRDWDGFIARLDPTQSGASSLLYSTYLGGGGRDIAFGIAVDGSGTAYVTGRTWSSDFPTLDQYQSYQGDTDAFVARLDPTKSGSASLLYSTYLGGNGLERGCGIAVDSSGTAYVTGFTGSSDFPTLDQYQAHQGDYDMFVSKLSFPLITVTSPNGGEDWVLGSRQDITWDAGNVSNLLTITLWQDGGLLGAIANDVDPGSGSYRWVVGKYIGGTAAAGTGYTVKIQKTGTSISDTSDAPFTLSVPFITVTSPNGGEDWQLGTTEFITWNSNAAGTVRISLWKEGKKVGNITKIETAAGLYDWTVGSTLGGSAPAGSGYAIKIKLTNQALFDISDGAFTISLSPASITLLSPNGGEDLPLGTEMDITWLASTGTGALEIDLWKDGARVGTIANNVPPSPGVYHWTVGKYIGGTAAEGTGYRVRIKEKGSTVSDQSDTSFTISAAPPSLTVTSPNGGERWGFNSRRLITWEAVNLTGLLKISLYRDDSQVGVIARNLEPSRGVYAWTVGQVEGGTAGIGPGYTVKIKEQGTAISDACDAAFDITYSAREQIRVIFFLITRFR